MFAPLGMQVAQKNAAAPVRGSGRAVAPRSVQNARGRSLAAYFSAAKAFAVIASTAPRPEILRTLGALASPEAAQVL